MRKATGELQIFKIIWEISNKRSYISSIPLIDHKPGTEMWFSYFSHVLSKNKYPYFRLYLRNIALLTKTEHQLYDAGTEEQRKEYVSVHPQTDWSLLDTLKTDLTEEYSKVFWAGTLEGTQMKWFLSEIKEKIYTLNCELLDKLVEDDFIPETEKITAKKILASL